MRKSILVAIMAGGLVLGAAGTASAHGSHANVYVDFYPHGWLGYSSYGHPHYYGHRHHKKYYGHRHHNRGKYHAYSRGYKKGWRDSHRYDRHDRDYRRDRHYDRDHDRRHR